LKKGKPPTFDRELKKLENVKAWLDEMKKLFELHNYIENMKTSIVIFSLKGKEYIWWEYLNCVRDIRKEDMVWHEFKGLFMKKYLSKR